MHTCNKPLILWGFRHIHPIMAKVINIYHYLSTKRSFFLAKTCINPYSV
jgi:hypothetical protein